MEWSHFGRALRTALEAEGATVVNLSIGGSSARAWAAGGPVCRTSGERRCLSLADLRAQGPYDIAIISLGTNDAANANAAGGSLSAAAERTVERLQTIVASIPAREVWIAGPPRMNRTTGHYTNATMEPVISAASRSFPRYIDSTRFGHIDGDGIHVGPAGGRAWAQLVMDSLHAAPAGAPGTSLDAGVTIGLSVSIGAAALLGGLLYYWYSGSR
jgi:lysophospholipase L1-like esterase